MTTFEALANRRRVYVDAARDNGFEEGLRKLLADLYPDNAHFIYELLQNAEDASAREVTFDLRPDGLYVEHDGSRLFDLRDIDSITGIGQSTKADDATTIGKFGVGFKAVFAYTQTPVIHSGSHSFAIHDLFVPTSVPPDRRPGLTTFYFPFDRADKPADRAVEEVSRALHDISRSTLLFLNHIRTITCRFPDGDERLLERRVVNDNVIAIEGAHEIEGPSYWYRITGDVPVGDKWFPVAAAFALEAQPQASASSKAPTPGARPAKNVRPEFTVTPIDGQVFIYFPAVRETSGLKFHVHAPFASTVARDSVRDDADNDQLVAGIASIVANELPTMCAGGLVTDGLLRTLPNDDDDLSGRYAVVRDEIIAAFQDHPITPVVGSNMFAPSRRLIRSASQLRSVFSLEDAELVRRLDGESDDDAAAVGWLPDRDGRPRKFLDSLEALNFGTDALAAIFSRIGSLVSEVESWGEDAADWVDESDLAALATWSGWLTSREDPWLRAFYAVLGRLVQQDDDPLQWSLDEAPIVRVQSDGGVSHVTGGEAYLPEVPGLTADSLVVDSLVSFDEGATKRSRQEHAALQAFYIQVAAKAWNATAQLEARLASYASKPPQVNSEHLEDLATLARLFDEHRAAPSTYSNRPLLVGVNADGTNQWTSATKVYLDEPFVDSGLSAISPERRPRGMALSALSRDYLASRNDVGALARRLGAVAGLSIKSTAIWTNPQFEHSWRWSGRENRNLVYRDWVVEYFSDVVASYDPRLLARLWELIVDAPEASGVAVYQANGSSKRFQVESQLLQSLKSLPWILDRDGNMRLPAATTKEDLAPSLEWKDAPLLRLAGFGR